VTLATLPAAAGSGTTVTYTDTTPARNSAYYYRVLANGAVVGDASMANFPTMSANSVSDTKGPINTFTSGTATPPVQPDPPTATPQAGPQVSLTWRDNATNETGFVVERAANGGAWVQIATAPARNNTGNVTFVDTTVAWGTTYLYRVAAFNGAGPSLNYAPTTGGVSAVVPALPAAPTSATVSVVKAGGNNYTATLNWVSAVDPTSFTIQRATNLSFTTGLNTSTVAGNLRTTTQTISRNTTYYYRIRANNNLGGSSAWTNAQPFPIRTGP
jgi:hypothetical protein